LHTMRPCAASPMQKIIIQLMWDCRLRNSTTSRDSSESEAQFWQTESAALAHQLWPNRVADRDTARCLLVVITVNEIEPSGSVLIRLPVILLSRFHFSRHTSNSISARFHSKIRLHIVYNWCARSRRFCFLVCLSSKVITRTLFHFSRGAISYNWMVRKISRLFLK
jgi:hypothetical protein